MKTNLTRLFFFFLLGTTLLNVVPAAITSSTPTVFVSPSVSFAAPGESFNVTWSIKGAVDVYAWSVNMTFDPNILEFQNIVEGDFLKNQPEGTSGIMGNAFVGYVWFSVSTRQDYMGVDGKGELATVKFKVKEGITGETILNISDPGVWDPVHHYYSGGTQLLDHLERAISRTTVDGFFANSDYPPVASFTYSPSLPEVGETVYFNASASVDPEGNITQYEWDFGDGNSVNETEPVTTHSYSDFGVYIVTLTVVDNASMPHVWYETYSTTVKEIETRSPHNIGVFSVTAYPSMVQVGEPVSVDVTVRNKGSWNETFNVNIYYDGHSAAPAQTVTNLAPDANRTLSFTWDTAQVNPGTYRINATAGPVEAELNTADNTKLSGTITVEAAGIQSYIGIIIIIVVVIIIAVVAFLLLRRRRSSTA